MQHEATIRQELAQLERLLAERRRHLPPAYRHAMQDSAWLRSQVTAWGPLTPPTPGHSRWLPAVAAASVVAGLITVPPGYALPAAGSPPAAEPANLEAGGIVPPPPVLLAPQIALAPASAVPSAPVAVQPISPAAPAVPVAVQPPAPDPVPVVPGEAPDADPDAPMILLPFENRQAAEPAAAPAPRPATRRPQPRLHIVRPGDTLIRLARKYYQGAGSHWRGIFAFNRSRIKDADLVFPGDRLVIPPLAEAIAAERGNPSLATGATAVSRPAGTHARRPARWRHKTRMAQRDPILRPRPGLPI